ncbi:hypothetical protein [Kutzneria sp. CA-103260]|uniref:hypothetical protein n=1 Tax=Kutzneria sp. CA-103260 TaxID=2802641 RepID=UPI001BAC22C5|nr:hypothetical protein [Kutzneria sp. CA-103260]QUQ71171.1 hypothetical protein JJ691_89550 [Kutzneria sp. CA-103260]
MTELFTTWLTSTDRIDHAVTDEQFYDNRPEPEAVCGAVITLATMETLPGPHCARCAAFLAARESLRDLDQRLNVHRHRRPGWLGRLLHRDTPTPAVPTPPALGRHGRSQTPVDAVSSPAAAPTGFCSPDGGQ